MMSPRVPFVVDVCRQTFEQLDCLLVEVCEGLDGHNDWPPPQEKECMAVAALNLLNLQVSAMHIYKHNYTHNYNHNYKHNYKHMYVHNYRHNAQLHTNYTYLVSESMYC